MHLEDDGTWYGSLEGTEMLSDEIQQMFQRLAEENAVLDISIIFIVFMQVI